MQQTDGQNDSHSESSVNIPSTILAKDAKLMSEEQWKESKLFENF